MPCAPHQGPTAFRTKNIPDERAREKWIADMKSFMNSDSKDKAKSNLTKIKRSKAYQAFDEVKSYMNTEIIPFIEMIVLYAQNDLSLRRLQNYSIPRTTNFVESQNNTFKKRSIVNAPETGLHYLISQLVLNFLPHHVRQMQTVEVRETEGTFFTKNPNDLPQEFFNRPRPILNQLVTRWGMAKARKNMRIGVEGFDKRVFSVPSFTGPKGKKYTVDFDGDENGQLCDCED